VHLDISFRVIHAAAMTLTLLQHACSIWVVGVGQSLYIGLVWSLSRTCLPLGSLADQTPYSFLTFNSALLVLSLAYRALAQ
jgi:hypothetical protein